MQHIRYVVASNSGVAWQFKWGICRLCRGCLAWDDREYIPHAIELTNLIFVAVNTGFPHPLQSSDHPPHAQTQTRNLCRILRPR